MKVKIRVFGLTPHDDGEADAITVEYAGAGGNLEPNIQYTLDQLDAIIHKENAEKGSFVVALAALMRATLEGSQVGDVTVEELYGPNFATRGQDLDLFSAWNPQSTWKQVYSYGAFVTEVYPELVGATDKQIYNAYMQGKISKDDCNRLLKTVDREGNAAKFRKDHPEYD